MATVLDANNYYNLEYSLIPENKIRQITGSVTEDSYDKDVNYNFSITKAINNKTNIDGSENVSIDLKNLTFITDGKNEQTYRYKQLFADGSYYNELYQQNIGYEIRGRIETIVASITITVQSNTEPIIPSRVNTSFSGECIKSQWTSESLYRVKLDLLEDNDNMCLGDSDLISYFESTNKENGLDSNIDIYQNGMSYGNNYYNDAYNKFCNDFINIDDLIIDNSLAYHRLIEYSKGTGNQGNVKTSYKYVDDYTWEVTIEFPYKYNAYVSQRYEIPNAGGTFSDPTGGFSLNIVRRLDISVVALAPGGNDVQFDYSLDLPDSFKYKTSLTGKNELVTHTCYVGSPGEDNTWSKFISNTLLDKYKDGKLWISAKVRNTFMIENDIHIDSRVQIKDIDNEYITRNETVLVFEVKNIEMVYKESQCYYNVILMEV